MYPISSGMCLYGQYTIDTRLVEICLIVYIPIQLMYPYIHIASMYTGNDKINLRMFNDKGDR